MERRDVLRVAILTAFGAASTKYDALAQSATSSGAMSCALDQWKWLVFTYKGKQVTVPMSEAFLALEEAYGSTKVK